MRAKLCVQAAIVGALALFSATGIAQTLATGDSRTVTEPVFPPVCATLASQLAIVSGGPANETTFDTSRIQDALTACPSGQAVELAPATGNNAFLIAPINIPSGVSLIVDGGVTVFASRNPADYQVAGAETCGTYGSAGNGCNNLIQFNKNSTNANSGIYGYGVIDGRGNATMLTGANAGETWWANADKASAAGESQDNFVIMSVKKSTNFTLYKITLRNSPMFHFVWSGSGLTAWDVKIATPFATHNTDGIDPEGSNITITKSSISDGDDDIAVSASSASSNITVSNSTTYSGHGISVGSYTEGGLTNFLVNNVNMAGTASDGNATGIRLKSSEDRGGLVQTVTYENMCLKDIHDILEFNPFYNTNTGTSIPTFQNIILSNVHFLAPTTNQYPYTVQLQGHDASHVSTIILDNVVFDSLLQANVTPAPEYDAFTLQGNVYPEFLQTLTGTGVSYSGAATATAGAGVSPCPLSVFPYLIGELYATTSTANSLQTATISPSATVTLNAMVEPAMSQVTFSGTAGSYTGAAAPSQPINFYEGTTLLGTGTLNANGTIASLSLSNLSVGTHTYTAQYPGDANYNALPFGSVSVVVTAASTPSVTTLTAPSTASYGASTTLSAAVTGTGGTPTGTVAFYDGTTSLGSSALTAGVGTLSVRFTGGAHSLIAVYSGDATFVTSTSTASTLNVSTAATTTAVSANPTTVTANATTVLTATVTGLATAAVPTGTVSFTDGTTSLGNATLSDSGVATLTATLTTAGPRTLTASYSGDANYAVSSGTAAVTVVQGTTTTTLTAPSTDVYGTAITLSSKVTGTGGTPTGSITFYDGTTALGTNPLSSGGATLTGVLLGGGAHSLTAVYSGDSVFPSSTSAASPLTVALATPSTTLTVAPSTAQALTPLNLTATVTGVTGAATPTGMVTFSDGATVLGTGALTGNVATLATSLSTFGSQTITATYSGDTNYGGSTGTATEVVTAIATTTSLTLSPASAFDGSTVTMTATVSPAAPGSVTFLNGSTVLGTAPLNASGVATFSYTAPSTTVGSFFVTASYTAAVPYTSSVSSAQQLTLNSAFILTSGATTLSVSPGSSGSVTLSLAPGPGFTGAVALACSSPVTFITCTLGSSSVTLNGTSASTVNVTIAVASTTSSLAPTRSPVLFAMLAPLGLLGLALSVRRRSKWRGVALTLLLLAMGIALTGCGGSPNGSGGSTTTNPGGTQLVTITATASGSTQTTQVVVTY